MYVKSNHIYTQDGCVAGILHIENGKFVEVLPMDSLVDIDVDATDKRVLPGIIDTHNHGTHGYGMMGTYEDPENIVRGYLKGLAAAGVTSCFPTADYQFFKAIANVSKTTIDGASIAGIHSEGPYLNRVGEKGVDTGHPDIDLEHIKKMVEDSEGLLKLFAIAPELPHAKEAIEYLTSQGVRCAFAHSNDNYHQAMESFDWGISVVTHTANVMAGIHHRNMGGLGAALLHDGVFNELICDGLHVCNEMIEILFRVKKDPFHKFMMISDNVPMAGAPFGVYQMGDLKINMTPDGYCLTDTGRLCGSSLPVIRGVKNLVENMHIPMENVLMMCSENPAKVYGFFDKKGSIATGKDADFIIIDDAYQVEQTFVEGRKVFDYTIDTNIFNEHFLDEYAVK